MNREFLIDAVAEATSGSASDPLTRDDVAKVVDATVRTLYDEHADKGMIGELAEQAAG